MTVRRFNARAARVTALFSLATICVFTAPAFAGPPSTAYKLIMADTFDQPTLDTMKWNYNYPSWFLNGGHEHNDQGYTTPDRVNISNGVLDLSAATGRDPNATDFYRDDFGEQHVNYTEGAINTSGKLNITHGYIETSIKLYGSTGSWPAIWMLGDGWPPEIDMMEFPRGTASGIANNNNTAMFDYHYTNGSSNASYYDRNTSLPTLTDGFHTFGLEWTSSVMNFSVDGTVRYSVTDSSAIADAVNMYLIFNQGVGGWAGDVTGDFTSHFWIDYVKIWQIPSTGIDTTWKSTVGSGSWDTSANWGAGVPKYEDSIARFTANDNAVVNPTWSNSRIVGGLHFDTTTTAYTIGSSAGSLQFAKAASGANATIYMTQATAFDQTIASRVELYDGVTATNNSPQNLIINGNIIGTGGLSKAGPGVLVLAGDNTFSGGLGFVSGGSIGDSGIIRLSSSTAAGTGTVNLPASNASSQVIELANNISVANNLTTAGRSSPTFLRNYRGDNAWTGDITINALGGAYAIESANGSLSLSGTLSTTLSNASDRVFNLTGTAIGTLSGTVADGASTHVGIAKQGSGTWTLSGANSYSAGTTVSEGTLVAAAAGSLGSGPIDVEGGTLRIDQAQAIGATSPLVINDGSTQLSPGLSQAVAVSSLAISVTGQLQLADNGLIVHSADGDPSTTLAAIQSDLLGGTIVSSVAASDNRMAIGFGIAASLHLTSFEGVDVAESDTLLHVTLRGDTNLDDAVDFSDLLTLAQNYGLQSDQTWTTGDFDHDGKVDFSDLLALAQNYGASDAPLPDSASPTFAADWALAQSLVPEPATLMLAPLTLMLTGRRRKLQRV